MAFLLGRKKALWNFLRIELLGFYSKGYFSLSLTHFFALFFSFNAFPKLKKIFLCKNASQQSNCRSRKKVQKTTTYWFLMGIWFCGTPLAIVYWNTAGFGLSKSIFIGFIFTSASYPWIILLCEKSQLSIWWWIVCESEHKMSLNHYAFASSWAFNTSKTNFFDENLIFSSDLSRIEITNETWIVMHRVLRKRVYFSLTLSFYIVNSTANPLKPQILFFNLFIQISVKFFKILHKNQIWHRHRAIFASTARWHLKL